jgi:hypothetical protein
MYTDPSDGHTPLRGAGDDQTLNRIWLDCVGDPGQSEVKVSVAVHEGEAGFASDCTQH